MKKVFTINPENQFKLYPYKDALTHVMIINKNQLSYYLWLEIPHHLSKCISLYEIIECTQKDSPGLDLEKSVCRDSNRPWIRIETTALNTEVGYHLYKLSFFDIKTDDVTALYFAYHVQTDNPDVSSYVYMKREENQHV